MTTARPDLATLMLHQEWVRGLARMLVRDAATADDVAQQTMLEAVTKAPADLRQPKGWLLRVARNAARAFVRQERRRTRREQLVAPATATTTTDPAVTVQRAAAHKQVVDTLFALPEPYHTVVLLRFFEDIDAHEIARRLERPVATVRTQLQRGLAQMRERLDAEFGGDRRAWCAMLGPLLPAKAAGVGVPLVSALGALLMTKWMLAAAAGLLILVLAVWQLDAVHGDTPLVQVPSPRADAVAATTPDAAPDAARTPAAPARDDAPASAPTNASMRRGRLLTIDGQALAGVVVASRDPRAPYRSGDHLVVGATSMDLGAPGNREAMATPEGRYGLASGFGGSADAVLALLEGRPAAGPRTTTDSFGRFAIAGADDRDRIEIDAEGLLLYGEGVLPDEADPVFIAGPAVSIGGIVRDQRGAPLRDVYVHVGFQLDSLPGIGARLRGADRYRSWNASTAADGTFALSRVPALDVLQVTAQKRGHLAMSLRTSSPTLRAPIDWTLRDDEHKAPTLAGVVRHADGRPAARADLYFGQDHGVADDSGRFSFALTYWHDHTVLTASVRDHQPCVLEGLGQRLRTDAAAGSALDLQLGGPTRTIAGRVLDADGKPLAGLRVVLADARFLGTTDQLLESLIADQGDVFSDAMGRFELRGLSERPYVVRAVDPKSLLVLSGPSVAAGTIDLELRAPAAAFFEQLEGTLVDRRGVPVAGAAVELRALLNSGGSMSKSLPRRDGVTSDGNGRFRLERCPRRLVQVVVRGDGIAWTVADVPVDGAPMRLEVVRRLRFRLTRLGGAAATAFEVHDVAGRVLHTTACRPGVRSEYSRVGLQDLAPVYEVDDGATTLVLFAGNQELRREAVVLRSDDVTEIGY